jgi:putative oxidoreductase
MMFGMTIVRRLARPLLAASFISGGIDELRNPKPKVPAADKVVSSVPPKLPSFISNTEDLVKADAVAKIVGGVLLALGKFPRPAALGLAASLIGTTLAGHRFWEESDPDKKAAQQIHFLKNLSIVGGLFLAAVDTEGKPSLAWRGRRAAAGLRDSATDTYSSASDSVHDLLPGS